ncbi:MAG: DUF2383 domain-containing protein [Nitrosomonas sp.]|nr:DUF2383 domain-containing protein [Nitrosomonas sp.]
MNNPEIATLLNGLVEISRDGTEGFKTCADNASDLALEAYFQECAQSCEEAVRVLSLEVMHYGGNPDMSGTAAGGVIVKFGV